MSRAKRLPTPEVIHEARISIRSSVPPVVPLPSALSLLTLMETFGGKFLDTLLGCIECGTQASAALHVGRMIGKKITLEIHLVGQPGSVELTADDWRHFAVHARGCGLRLTANSMERMALFLEYPERESDPDGLWVELGKRVREELESVFLVRLENDEPELYAHKTPFGEAVRDAFPSSAKDACEAARCRALGRYTASVFHLMRTLEAGLAALSRDVGITEHSPTWKVALDRIEKRIREHEQAPAQPPGPDRLSKARLEFLSAAAANLRAFKDAWRDRTTHDLLASYDKDEARDIYNAVGAFMRQLATQLRESAPEGEGA